MTLIHLAYQPHQRDSIPDISWIIALPMDVVRDQVMASFREKGRISHQEVIMMMRRYAEHHPEIEYGGS